MQIHEEYIVLDIETDTEGRSTPDPDKDVLKYVGFKHKDNRVCFNASEKEKIQRAISWGKYIVGHNIKNYDKKVLERHGFKFNYKQVLIDTYEISENRLKSMMYLDLNTGDKSLSALCERFNLEHKKGEFDYSLLSKDSLTEEEYNLLVEYLFGDLDAADDLFKYFYEFFYGFREYMNTENQERMCWLINRPGSTAYKCVCNLAGLKEEYEDVEETDEETYEGGFVSEPYIDNIEGNIYVYDYSSLFPHMYLGFCLFNKIQDPSEKYFKGTNIYPLIYGNEMDGIKGKYRDHWGPIELAINELFTKRMDVTKRMKETKDPIEKIRLTNERLAIKILINTMYGVSGSPKFKSIYDPIVASDCTSLARRTIKHARTTFEYNGYKCIYTDTDSIYVEDVYNDEKRIDDLVSNLSEEQRCASNKYVKTHGMVKEHKIKRMYFFRDDQGKFIKKHYIYLCDNDELVIKGISVKRGNCSPIAKKFFYDVIKPKMIDGTYKPYKAQELLDELKSFIVGKEEMLLKRFRLKPLESYKVAEGKDESSAINAQLSKRYGSGEIFLLANKRIGVGKGNKYCTLEELKEKYGIYFLDQITYESYLQELKEFIEWQDRRNIHKQDRKRVTNATI